MSDLKSYMNSRRNLTIEEELDMEFGTVPTISESKAEREAWTYSRCRAAYISGAIGEHTFRVSLEILGLRGQDIEAEVNCAKGERR